MSEVTKNAEAKMKKAIEALRKNLSGIRTGRASPALVEHLMVEYYGTQCPLQQLAGISIPEPRTISIQPYDKGAVKEIEKAIMKSDLGLSPKTDAGVIRLNLPQLTEERRKELVKLTKKEAEESKVALRNIRREAMDQLKAQKESKLLTEDALKMEEDELQKLTDRHTQETDKMFKAKEKEIMEV